MNSSKPVQTQTNESKVRLIAFWVLLLLVIYWLDRTILIPVLLVIDFSLRSFDLGKFSPLALVSDWVVKTFRFPVKPVYLPPKRFAARIGCLLSVVILIFHSVNLNTIAIIMSSILAAFAALESFTGFCAGCYVFNFLQRFRNPDPLKED